MTCPGGLNKISQIKRLKELETENARLDVWVMERSNPLARGYLRHMRCWFGGGQGFLPAFRQASKVMMGMVTSMQPVVNMPGDEQDLEDGFHGRMDFFL